MATTISAFTFLFAFFFIQAVHGAAIGVNYGRLANNLPPPPQVARFLAQTTTITGVKLFDADPFVLQAFAGTNLSINLAIPNELIPKLTNLSFAQHWVHVTILPHIQVTNITRILVGNEILSTANKSLIRSLVPAMQNIHTALTGVELHHRIKVSSTHSLSILSTSTPPSTGQFRKGYDTQMIKPMLSFLRATNSTFMVNAYPFFGCNADTLDYALFRGNTRVFDENTGLVYMNMLDGQLDAVYSAMKLLGFTDIEIVISETGWPSVGDESEAGVDIESARDYNAMLLQHVTSGVGTPLMPNRTFETYIFSLFNEDLKPGPRSERNFGLFHPDMTPVYDIGILRSEGELPMPVRSTVPPEVPDQGQMKQWCIPKLNADIKALQENIDFVCSQGLDCNPILPGGICFSPDITRAHAAYAMNEYFQAFGRNSYNCDFGQTGEITTTDPSYGSCKFN
ncbi:glucan endo-1,3-beta-glucosidase-like isoform X1 [Dioscorea cayenensis subsp. rotundata]|uniref:glucan endo-1,3-beta-D-glucosidase n=1 Tax=Dioscorea cayennensis subsp. rotundata TaxID=55577 RepID=A0AB40C985_DIOCR|nr:glucan endo-1,3-beta-glucosidase-like isoform X1 [Dioscorea cayenensis subsp. rotundata]